MSADDSGADRPDVADEVAAGLVRAGVEVVASLPDSWLTGIIDRVEGDDRLTHVRVTREDDGVAICAGAYLAGSMGAVVCQSAGILVSVNALAGFAMHHQIPLVILAAYRGRADDDQYYQVYKGRITVPVLEAIGLPYHVVSDPDDTGIVEQAVRQARLARLPVVVLYTRGALQGRRVAGS